MFDSGKIARGPLRDTLPASNVSPWTFRVHDTVCG